MSPWVRKLALTAHIAASLGWLGAAAAFLALSVAALASGNERLVGAVYVAAEPITWYAIVPLGLAALATGIVQSVGTRWGLVQHYWVLIKLLLTVVAVAILMMYTRTVEELARAAEAGFTGTGGLRSFVLHSAGAAVVLLANTVLAVYKPRGLTPWAKRQVDGGDIAAGAAQAAPGTERSSARQAPPAPAWARVIGIMAGALLLLLLALALSRHLAGGGRFGH